MGSAGTNGCDGCGRECSSAELYPVELPSGDTAICCPECRSHAKAAAQRQAELVATDTCDGCDDRIATDELTEIALPDGATVECCPDCASEARRPDDGTGTGDGRSSTTAPADGNDDPPATEDRTGDESEDRCDQCLEPYSIELHEVVTVDDRTERLCPDCKREAVAEGVVSTVRMRRAEAYRILDVDGPAGRDDLRRAYLDRVRDVHPDRENGDREAFKRVQRAFDRLTEG